MDKELQDLKSVLRSLVVSSPAQVDVRSLVRDYRAMMGTPIPISKYGYRDILTFLKERCADCFLFQGPPSNPVLTLIVPDTLKHIDQFVQRQKSTQVTKMKGKRRSVAETLVKQPEKSKFEQTANLICRTFPKNIVSTQNFNRHTPEIKSNNCFSEVTLVNHSLKEKSNNHTPEVKLCNHTPEVKLSNHSPKMISNPHPLAPKLNYHTSEVKPNSRPPEKSNNNGQEVQSNRLASENRSNNIPANYISPRSKVATPMNTAKSENIENSHAQWEETSYNTVSNLLKKRHMMYDSSIHEEYNGHDKACSKEDNDSGRQTSSSQSSTKKAQLEELKYEVHELIREHENGVLCTEILRLYRERYSRELNLSRFGHNNINSVLCAMGDSVCFAQEAGGVRVRDAGAAPRPPARRLPLAAGAAPGRSLRALPVDPDDALPGIDFEPDVFPPDCMSFMESIPTQSLEGVCAGAMLEVMVGEVYSPSHFWLQRIGPRHKHAMDDVMDEMLEYYNSGAGRDRFLARGAVRPGHYCASVYEGDWHRSLIVKIIDADNVKVRHVDYGTVECVAVRSLKPLVRTWAALPAQAVRARLAGLRPGAGGRRWPHAAAAHFLHLVHDKHFVANVVAVDPEENTLETFLIDTSGADDVCVSAELIRAGHADARADSALRSGECGGYLLPRFEALECGATPNYGEIHRYLADGISLEYVEAYRQHVATALPAARLVPVPSPLPSPSPSPPPARLDSPLPVASPRASYRSIASDSIVRENSLEPPSLESLSTEAPPPCATASEATSTPGLKAASIIATLCPAPGFAAPTASSADVTSASVNAGPAAGCEGGAENELRLSLAECEVYSLLNSLDPAAAHCYMLAALRRAAATAVVPASTPSATPAPPPSATRAPATRSTSTPTATPARSPSHVVFNPQAPEFNPGFPLPRAFGPSPPAFGLPPPAFGPALPVFGPIQSAFVPFQPSFGPFQPSFGPPPAAFGPPPFSCSSFSRPPAR